jgi:O-antigen ligase
MRTVFLLVPVIALYFAAGWESQYGKFYRPVRLVRSIVDAQSDQSGSSMWREFENFNLVSTYRFHPILGTGYGHRYLEFITMPGVDYSLEFYAPHNSLLGLWAFSGLIGFAGVTMLWIAGNYFAMRAYRNAQDADQRAAAIVCFGALPIYLLQSWGDLGLGSWTGVFIMSASICVSGKLAVALGQWRPTAFRQG